MKKLLLAISITVLLAGCQANHQPAEERLRAFSDHLNMENATTFTGEWVFIGPEIMSGRISDIDVPKGSTDIIYAAAATGGVWKSSDAGATWFPVLEKEASASVGDIAVAPSDPDIIFAGLGEANAYRSGMSGTGIYRSEDAGTTWHYTGLAETGTVGRIVIHPGNPDIIFVGASGRTWKNSPDRGVYKSTDGGNSWTKVFYLNDGAGCIDLVMDPSNPTS
ncbi:MAG: lipoprotein [Bacteroidales bacterium]